MFSLRICHKSISNKMIIEETNLTKVSQRKRVFVRVYFRIDNDQWQSVFFDVTAFIQKNINTNIRSLSNGTICSLSSKSSANE